MKKLILAYLLFLCFDSKAQTKDSLIKLYNRMVRIDRAYSSAFKKALMETGSNARETTSEEEQKLTGKIDSLEKERWKAHDAYNDYWYRYHEKKGDVNQMINPDMYGSSK